MTAERSPPRLMRSFPPSPSVIEREPDRVTGNIEASDRWFASRFCGVGSHDPRPIVGSSPTASNDPN